MSGRAGFFGDADTWASALERLASIGLADVYFERSYVALYACNGAQPETFVYEDGGEFFFMPYLIRPIESLALARHAFDLETAYGYGGPLASTEDHRFLAAAWSSFRELCRARGIVAGFFRFHPLLETQRFADPKIVRVIYDRETVSLSLSKNSDAVWAGYSPNTRNKVRKGEKSGVIVTWEEGNKALAAFSAIYQAHMEEIDADENYFFDNGYFAAIGKLPHRVYFARRFGETLGGSLVLFSARFAHYHLSSSAKAHLAFAPNNMLRHGVTMSLLDRGLQTLHYGGGRTAAADDTLFRFKANFSPERARFALGQFVSDAAAYEMLCVEWAQKYPDLIARFGGRFLRYRYH